MRFRGEERQRQTNLGRIRTVEEELGVVSGVWVGVDSGSSLVEVEVRLL